jgi:hypothetical protein
VSKSLAVLGEQVTLKENLFPTGKEKSPMFGFNPMTFWALWFEVLLKGSPATALRHANDALFAKAKLATILTHCGTEIAVREFAARLQAFRR